MKYAKIISNIYKKDSRENPYNEFIYTGQLCITGCPDADCDK